MTAFIGAMRAVGCVSLLTFVGACAFGNKVDYTAQAPVVVAKPTEVVVVGVHDRRSYVVSGDKSVQFVGLQRGGYGNPFGVHTSSGRPLSDEFAAAIANSLGTQEPKAQVVSLAPTMSRDQALAQLTAGRTSKILFVTIAEWKSDLYLNLRMQYDLLAAVIDRSGKILGEHQVRGDQNLGAHPLMYNAYSTTLPAFQKTKLEELLNDPKISQALSQSAPTRPARPQRRR